MTNSPANSDRMMAITLPTHGGPDALVPATVQRPVPQNNQVLVRVAAAGVNGPDISQREGHYPPPANASPLPGLEVSGTVESIGSDVKAFAPGDAVVALCNGGGYAEYVVVPAGQVLPKPHNWDFNQAATLPETFFTIEQTLIVRGQPKPGGYVLIHGGGGGIGATAIQMTRLYGAIPIATVSNPTKADYAREMGAAHIIDYKSEDFVARTLEITEGYGADIILDIVGAAYANRNFKAAARGGHILQLAVRSGAKAEINLGLILMKALTLSGSTLRPLSSERKADIAERLNRSVWPHIAQGTIKPPRIRTFALEEAPAAHRAMESAEHFGKIVLVTAYGKSLAT